jgi:hypothetical protein
MAFSASKHCRNCPRQKVQKKRYNFELRAITPKIEMKVIFTLVLVCSIWCPAQGPNKSVPASGSAQPPGSTNVAASSAHASANLEDESSRKARALVQQAIQALGGDLYLNIRDREQQGRGYSFHHGRPSGGGDVFWSFTEFPDKERVEYTKERDIARVYVGNKGYEITYKGAHPVEQKDLEDYLRRRRFSLDVVLRIWITDPGVIFLFEGPAIAAQHSAVQVTLINAQNESVTLDFDIDTHLPVKKSFEWRDPVDKQKNLEEEIYENYRSVSGIMAPYNLTRYFNGDMSNQRFLNSVTINQGLDGTMFDPNSGYNPNKPVKK